ncbi:Atp-dependent RNA helicase ddx20, partial [Globisporangium splendens]
MGTSAFSLYVHAVSQLPSNPCFVDYGLMLDGDLAGDTYEQQLTNLVTGEIDKQLKERNDVVDAVKSQMTKVLKEFEDMTWNVNAKRSWMKSVTKASKGIAPTSAAPIHPATTTSNIVPPGSTSPSSRLPKLSAALKGRKKHQVQLSRNVSGVALPNSQASDDARSPDGKIVFDKKLPRVAHMEKRVDGLQSVLATQQKQQMYERALERFPQCRSDVFAPSIYDDRTSDAAESTQIPAPQSFLELDFVYGMHTSTSGSSPSSLPSNSNCSNGNNVFYLSTGEVLWFTAALVVLYTKESNTQQYFREHTNEVTNVGVHPNQYIVASGQTGRQTHLLVWNAKGEPIGKRFTCLPGHSVAVRAISFSHDGKLIASLGGDMYNAIFLVATNYNDHTLGRIIAGTAKGDLCVFCQPRRSPEPSTETTLGTTNSVKQDGTAASGANEVEPAKWWEIPDEHADVEINALVLERIKFELTARLVEVVPHDQETGNRFKLTKQAQAEIDGITERLTLKPNSATLHARLNELRYSGPVAHSDAATQVAFCKKNGLVLSCGGDGRSLLWKCHMQHSMRVPGVNTLGVFTPLATGTFSEGSHQLMSVDQDTRVFHLPTMIPGENSSGITAKPTSLQWKEDGKFALSLKREVALWSHAAVIQGKRKSRPCPSMDTVKAVCMDFYPFGDELAIGMTNGELVIVGYHELKVVAKKTIKPHSGSSSAVDLRSGASSGQGGLGSGASVSQLKYCPKGNFLAVGAKDTFVYLYDLGNNYKRMHMCEGHSSAITQLTWNAEGDLLQSNASDGELLYWSISRSKANTKQITDVFLVRDAQWVKWSCAFGWPTPGIWSENTTSLVDIAAVCTTEPKSNSTSRETGGSDGLSNPFVTSVPSSSDNTEDLIAVTCKSSVRLFKWPAIRSAKFHNYLARAATIPSLCFSFNDKCLTTVGGEDATIIQWRLTQGSASPARRSPSKPSPIARKRPQRGFGDEFDSATVGNTSPVPPPATERTDSSQRSPRQHLRQYRERLERGDEPPEAAQSKADNVSDHEQQEDEQGTADSKHSQVLFQVRAKHDFQAENPDELSIEGGEILRVFSRENEDWWLGERCDGVCGIFPSSYVEVIDRDDESAASAAATRNSDPSELAVDAITEDGVAAAASAVDDVEQDAPGPVPAYRYVNAAVDAQAELEAEGGTTDTIDTND